VTGPFRGTIELEPGLAEAEHGPRTLAPFGRRAASVTANEALGPYRLLALEDAAGPAPLPGQFYMLACASGWGEESGRPHLGRAFSVCRARGPRLEFLLEAIGPGTERLAQLAPGDAAWLVGPLGIGFTPPSEGGSALLVGGGIGVAPLVIWAEALRELGTGATRSLLGFRSGSFAAAARLFAGGGGEAAEGGGAPPVEIATDDGTAPPAGTSVHHGLVTDLLVRALGPASTVYACGPPPMLEAVRRICVQRSIPAQLAMEAGMACGFGACFGCVVRTRHGYRRLCVDGPVVAAEDLAEGWE
jgi:dihydroorotate dehydrogenase electron transfer subunit